MRSIAINSLGEMFLNKQVVGGTVCLNDIGLPKKVVTSRRKDHQAKVAKAVAQAIDRQIDASFTLAESYLVRSVLEKQAVNDSRFRVYACTEKGKLVTVLATEFIFFVDDKEAKDAIYKTAKEVVAKPETMREDKHTDKSRPETQKHWNYGPNHGRMERQVQFIWNVTALTVNQIKAFIEDLKQETHAIWDKYGVGVL